MIVFLAERVGAGESWQDVVLHAGMAVVHLPAVQRLEFLAAEHPLLHVTVAVCKDGTTGHVCDVLHRSEDPRCAHPVDGAYGTQIVRDVAVAGEPGTAQTVALHTETAVADVDAADQTVLQHHVPDAPLTLQPVGKIERRTGDSGCRPTGGNARVGG